MAQSSHLFNINNVYNSHLFSSANRAFIPSSPFFSNCLPIRSTVAPFPAFSHCFGPRQLQSKRSCGALGIRCKAGSSGEDSIRTKINENPVVVYSKSWCPYCQEVKILFQGLGVKPSVVELDELGPTERELQDALRGLTGQSTVPNVFIGGKHIGGCSDTTELHQKGELVALLKAAGVKVA